MRRGAHAGTVWLSPEQAKAFAERCRELRKAGRWSQRALAAKAQMTQSTVAYAENPERPLTQDAAKAIAAALGTTLAALLEGCAP